jgi:hypothetical protein
MYQNPYGDDSTLDPDAARRKALLDLMGTPDQAATPSASQTLPSSRPAPTGLATPGPTRATAANGADTPDLPDPAANPYGGAAAAGTPAKAGDDGRQYGTKILDLYDDPYTRRDTYGGWDPKRSAISSALVSSGNPYAMAAGALGYIDAWAHRKAETAPTDFSVQDATQIIRDAYKDMNGGKDISDEELNAALTGQGLRSGSGWVGQAGLQGVLGHLAENAAATRAAGGGAAGSAGAAASGGAMTAASTAPGGPLASNPNTGVAGGMDQGISGPGGASPGAAGGGSFDYLEGFDKGKFNDPNKSDTKYDFAHIVGGQTPTPATLDALWDQIVQKFPNAKRTGDDSIDFGDGYGSIDVIRAAGEGGKAWHFEPESGATDSAASAAPASPSASSPLTTPGAAQLAAPLANNDVLQQIMEELRRIQSGDAPRAAILSQMGLA